MIERLQGVCVQKHAHGVLVDVNGVGYGVEATPATVGGTAIGDAITVWVHTHVTQDSLRLFGFLTLAERQMFSQLLSVSGLGPKIAMAILSQIEPSQLVGIVEREEAEILEDVPGIGPRQSKKFILELKPKFAKLAAAGALASAPAPTAAPRAGAAMEAGKLSPAMLRDLQSALENFGYKERELGSILKKFEREPPAEGLASLVRLALAELSSAARADAAKAEELF